MLLYPATDNKAIQHNCTPLKKYYANSTTTAFKGYNFAFL